MYLYGSEHALMDYHLNTEKIKVATTNEVKAADKEKDKKPKDGLNTH